MKLVVSKSNLLRGVNIVSKAVPTRTTMAILECILIDASTNEIKLMANDLELGIETKIEGEILEIENKLKYAVIIKDSQIKKGIISLGSKVEFVDDETGECFTYEIVGTTEADVELGRISNESPIGNALLGRKAGEQICVNVPAGVTRITVKKVN